MSIPFLSFILLVRNIKRLILFELGYEYDESGAKKVCAKFEKDPCDYIHSVIMLKISNNNIPQGIAILKPFETEKYPDFVITRFSPSILRNDIAYKFKIIYESGVSVYSENWNSSDIKLEN